MQWFWSYFRKSRRRGRFCPPPSGARVKCPSRIPWKGHLPLMVPLDPPVSCCTIRATATKDSPDIWSTKWNYLSIYWSTSNSSTSTAPAGSATAAKRGRSSRAQWHNTRQMQSIVVHYITRLERHNCPKHLYSADVQQTDARPSTGWVQCSVYRPGVYGTSVESVHLLSYTATRVISHKRYTPPIADIIYVLWGN